MPDLQKQLPADSPAKPADDSQYVARLETGKGRREKLREPLWQMGIFPRQKQ